MHEGDVTALLPTRFTVATEDYLFSRRLYLYSPARPQNPWMNRFLTYVLSEAGQEIVSKAGFVKQSINVQRPLIPPGAPENYVKTPLSWEPPGSCFRESSHSAGRGARCPAGG